MGDEEVFAFVADVVDEARYPVACWSVPEKAVGANELSSNLRKG